MKIDAHFHSWQLARGDYGWLTPAVGVIYRDVAVADWQAQAAVHGIQGGVLVQAAPTEAETWHLLGLAQANPCVLGVVGWVDLLAPDALQRVGALAQHHLLKGLRPMLQDIADPDWVLQPEVQPALALMAERGLVFDALVKPIHLSRLLTLVHRHPGLRVVIDHAAKPDIARGEWQPWAEQMAALARQPQVYCKLSGLLTEAGPQPESALVQAWVAHVLQEFGPDRVLWGSDWPVLELASSYPAWYRACEDMVAEWSEPQRAALFGLNARRFYRLDTRGSASTLETV